MRRFKRRSYSLPVIATLALLVPTGAHAERANALSKDEVAVEHLRKGNRAMDLERYDEAIAEYEKGAMLDPVPIFFHNIALAHRNVM